MRMRLRTPLERARVAMENHMEAVRSARVDLLRSRMRSPVNANVKYKDSEYPLSR